MDKAWVVFARDGKHQWKAVGSYNNNQTAMFAGVTKYETMGIDCRILYQGYWDTVLYEPRRNTMPFNTSWYLVPIVHVERGVPRHPQGYSLVDLYHMKGK